MTFLRLFSRLLADFYKFINSLVMSRGRVHIVLHHKMSQITLRPYFLADFWQTFDRLLADFWQTFDRLLADFWQFLNVLLADFKQMFSNFWLSAIFWQSFGSLLADLKNMYTEKKSINSLVMSRGRVHIVLHHKMSQITLRPY